ncbi:MAG: DNA polymerase, partial [Patescibacteria group bacterium]
MAEKKKTLVLIDSHAVLHRAFHALPNFTSSKGEPTGALYGFSAFLIKIIKELNPDYIAACFDLPEPTFRHVAYEKYKAKRPKMDDTLALQINRSRDILNAFNIPIYDAKGFEADDVLGTITSQIYKIQNTKYKIQVIIASGDLDTLQLVKDNDVVVYTLSKGIKETVIYNEDAVKKRFGFGPELIPDFKALKGDPSDNIVGVPGIGDKSASELIQKFGTIENLYKKLKKDRNFLIEKGIKERVVKLLEDNEEEARFSKALAEIRKDAPIHFSLEKSEWQNGLNHEKVKNIFKEFGFRSLIERLPYLAKDPPSQLFERLKDQVPEKLFYGTELPLAKILKEMQETGILLDVDYLKKLSNEYHNKLNSLEKEIWSLAGEEFNINSPQQLSRILFEKIGLEAKKIKKTSTGVLSTNISELLKLKEQNPIIEKIISFREFAKLVNTYIDTLPKLVDKNNRLHTTFDQAGTTTGRISSKDPNLQNIPKRTELGRNIRRAFIAPPGFKLLAFDYSQIELRITAILSKDQKLLKAFKKGLDIHDAVASEVFNVAVEKVTPEMRRRAKIINFGIIYGMGVNALKSNLECSREEAQMFYDEYFNDFHGVADFIEKIKKETYQKGYTETIFGRKRFFPEIKSPI